MQQQQQLFQTPAQQPQQSPFQQSTPNPFLQQQPQQQQQPQFQFQPQPQPQPQPQAQPQFQFQPQQLQPQFQFQPQQLQLQPPQQPQRQIFLYKVDKTPASYNTKWEDLHPDSQKYLLQVEERVLEYRNESQRLDQCNRLYDSSVSNNGFELDASHIIQELGGISTAMEREKILVQELMTTAKDMMRETEFAVHSFMMLYPRFLHTSSTSNVGAGSQSTGATLASSSAPPMASSLPVFDFYSGIPKRPSAFLVKKVSELEKYLAECLQWIEELEQLLHMDASGAFSSSGTSLQSLPTIVSNVHDYFIHVAAKTENLHQYIESMRGAYLADQRRCGEANDPFLEADRREAAKQEAAAKRVHPTLHLPVVSSQPSNQVAGLIASSAIPGASTHPQQTLGGYGASSGSGFSLFATPASTASSASTSSSFLFSTPSSSAPASTLFGPSAASPQSTLFGSASTSLFGSAQTPFFGASTPSFASTPAIPAIGSTPLFSTPSFASGPTMGSGASFGATSRASKPKSRTSRR